MYENEIEHYIQQVAKSQKQCNTGAVITNLPLDYYRQILQPAIYAINNRTEWKSSESSIERIASTLFGQDKAVSGGALAFGTKKHSKLCLFGNRQELSSEKEPHVLPVTSDTIFDLASLTKIFTLVLALRLQEKQEFDINCPISEYTNRFPKLQQFPVKALMDFSIPIHTSVRLDTLSSQQVALNALEQASVSQRQATRRYSDMGAMILKYVMEDAVKRPFAELIKQEVTPWDIHNHISWKPDTEKCASNDFEYRVSNGTEVCLRTPMGFPNDPKARLLCSQADHLQGHAGIFSDAQGLIDFAQKLIAQDILEEKSLQMAAAPTLINRDSPHNSLGLLCRIKDVDSYYSEVDHMLSGQAFGIGGYTGGYFCIDPVNEVFAVLLGNRCHNRVTRTTASRDRIRCKDGVVRICNSTFAYRRDALMHEALCNALQMKMLECF